MDFLSGRTCPVHSAKFPQGNQKVAPEMVGPFRFRLRFDTAARCGFMPGWEAFDSSRPVVPEPEAAQTWRELHICLFCSAASPVHPGRRPPGSGLPRPPTPDLAHARREDSEVRGGVRMCAPVRTVCQCLWRAGRVGGPVQGRCAVRQDLERTFLRHVGECRRVGQTLHQDQQRPGWRFWPTGRG